MRFAFLTLVLSMLTQSACVPTGDTGDGKGGDADGDGVSAADGDCNDADAAIFPGADEHCDGVDEDCDSATDEAAVDAPPWYADLDGDGFGDPSVATAACEPPPGWVSSAGDCDDARHQVSPAVAEICDGLDNDCDDFVDALDEDLTDGVGLYVDGDGDGYGAGEPVTVCPGDAGYAEVGGDCDDGDGAAYPDSLEVPADGVDQDCDGEDACGALVPWEGHLTWTGEDLSWLCGGGYTAIDGDVTISGDAVLDLADFACICEISGSLLVEDVPALGDLRGLDHLVRVGGSLGIAPVLHTYPDALASLRGLDHLAEVGGDLFLAYAYILDDLHGLGSLRSVGGSMYLQALINLRDLDGLDQLESVGGSLETSLCSSLESFQGAETLGTVGGLYIDGGDALRSLQGLDGLSEAGWVVIEDTPSLPDLRGLEALESITGGLELTWNAAMDSTRGLDSLETVGGDVLIYRNDLHDLDGLSSLREVGGWFDLESEPDLDSLAGLSALERVGGTMYLASGGPLADLDGLGALSEVGEQLTVYEPQLADVAGLADGLSVPYLEIGYADLIVDLSGLDGVDAGGVGIGQCGLLEDLSGLEGFTSLPNGLYVVGNESLSSLRGVESLTRTGDLYIGWNDLLPALDGLDGLREVTGDLAIYNNAGLTSVAALEGVEGIGGGFTVIENESLSTSNAEALRDAIGVGNIGGNITISGNAP